MKKTPLHGYCKKCPHFKTCTVPCAPIQYYLEKNNHVHEGGSRVKPSNTVYPEPGIVQRSSMVKKDGVDQSNWEEEKLAFSTENESPWLQINFQRKLTYVFIMRALYNRSFNDIAEELGIRNTTAMAYYREAVEKVFQILIDLDKTKTRKNVSPEVKRKEAAERVARYRERHPERVKQAQLKQREKLKSDPAKMEEKKRKRKEYYAKHKK